MSTKPDTTIGPNCGYEALRGKKLRLSPTMFRRVKDCSYGVCEGGCCSFGCWVTDQRKEQIAKHFEGIKQYMDPSLKDVTIDDVIKEHPGANRKDHSAYDPIYEGMHVNESTFNPKTGMCVFLTHAPDNIVGCSIHKYAHDNNLPWKEIKPLGCSLFPARAYIEKNDPNSVVLSLRRWGKARCCQLVGDEPDSGPRAIDVQIPTIASLFDIPVERVQEIVDWYDPNPAPKSIPIVSQ